MVLFIINSALPSYNHKSENGNPVETSFRAAGIESYETNASDEILIETHREFKKTTSIEFSQFSWKLLKSASKGFKKSTSGTEIIECFAKCSRLKIKEAEWEQPQSADNMHIHYQDFVKLVMTDQPEPEENPMTHNLSCHGGDWLDFL